MAPPTTLAQLYEALHFGASESLLQSLEDLEAILQYDSAMAALVHDDIVEVMYLLLSKLERVDDADAHLHELVEVKVWLLLPQLLLFASANQAARIMDQTALHSALLRALQLQGDGWTHPHFHEALQCVNALIKHDFRYSMWHCDIVYAVASSIHDSVRVDSVALLVKVLLALGSENPSSARQIEQIAAARLPLLRSDLVQRFFHCMVIENRAQNRHYYGQPQLGEPWSSGSQVKMTTYMLKNRTSVLETLVTLEALVQLIASSTEDKTKTLAILFASRGGVKVLTDLTLSNNSVLVRERAEQAIRTLTNSDAQYLGHLIACQRNHPDVAILSSEFCSSQLSQLDWFSFPECMRFLTSKSEDDVHLAFEQLLARNINILAALCLDHRLLSILTHLAVHDRSVGEDVKHAAWQFVLEICYELPTIGITALKDAHEQQQLIAGALQMISHADEHPLSQRQQAAHILATPLCKSSSARDTLVDEEGGIVLLVHALAFEDDAALASGLSDLMRTLAANAWGYATEIEFIVNSLLESDDYTQCARIRYQNVLSMYRKSASVILGRAGEDTIENLRHNLDVLSSGNEVEKFIVLKQLRTRAASWTQAHWDVLCDHMLEIVPVVICETAEVKQLAVELLRVLAAVDDGCRRKVLTAQRIYGRNDPAFFQEFMVADDAESAVPSTEKEDNKRDEAAGEMGCGVDGACDDCDALERDWVTIDFPMNNQGD